MFDMLTLQLNKLFFQTKEEFCTYGFPSFCIIASLLVFTNTNQLPEKFELLGEVSWMVLSLLQVYETLTGVRVEGKVQSFKKDAVLQSLPPEWPQDHVLDIQKLKESNSKILVVLDDDPTGTQTVHDIEVLTEWYVLFIPFCHFSNSDFFQK